MLFSSLQEERLKGFHIPKLQRIEFLRDVFRNPAEFEEGLMDAENEECFSASLVSLQEIWNNREREFNDPQHFMIGLSVIVKRSFEVQC